MALMIVSMHGMLYYVQVEGINIQFIQVQTKPTSTRLPELAEYQYILDNIGSLYTSIPKNVCLSN
jgi:hypothetical protein